MAFREVMRVEGWSCEEAKLHSCSGKSSRSSSWWWEAGRGRGRGRV